MPEHPFPMPWQTKKDRLSTWSAFSRLLLRLGGPGNGTLLLNALSAIRSNFYLYIYD